MATLFTKIINREIPADIVYEDDDVIAFKDIAPVAPIHVLVVPKKEIPTINDISDEDASNCNEHGGQTVFHIHFHLIGGNQLGTMV